MKVTQSNDKIHRITIRVEHRISLGDLAVVIDQMLFCRQVISKHNIIQELKTILADTGYTGLEYYETSADYNHAQEIAKRLFPELNSKTI
jgi:hypothetical protein